MCNNLSLEEVDYTPATRGLIRTGRNAITGRQLGVYTPVVTNYFHTLSLLITYLSDLNSTLDICEHNI